MADTKAALSQLGECAERQDFEGAFALVKANRAELAKQMDAPEFVSRRLA